MAEIVSKGQASTGRLIEIVMVGIAGVAFVLVVAWVAFVASAPSTGTLTRTTQQYLAEPGLVDQRRGERGVDAATAPGQTLISPAMQEHRRGEREGN
jgi:hypothetical protein